MCACGGNGASCGGLCEGGNCGTGLAASGQPAGTWPGSFLDDGLELNGGGLRPAVQYNPGGLFLVRDPAASYRSGGTALDDIFGTPGSVLNSGGVGAPGTPSTSGNSPTDRLRELNAQQAAAEQQRLAAVSQGVQTGLNDAAQLLARQQQADLSRDTLRTQQQIAADAQAAETERTRLMVNAGIAPAYGGGGSAVAPTPASGAATTTGWFGVPVWIWLLGAAAVAAFLIWRMQPKRRRR